MSAEKLLFMVVFFAVGIVFIGMPVMLPNLMQTDFFATLFVGLGFTCFAVPIMLLFKD